MEDLCKKNVHLHTYYLDAGSAYDPFLTRSNKELWRSIIRGTFCWSSSHLEGDALLKTCRRMKIKFCSSFIIYLIPVLFTVVSVFKETLLLLLFGDTGEQAVVVNRFLRGCCVLIPRFIGHSNFSIILL